MLKADIDKDLKTAMISGDKARVEILRTIKSAILYKEVSDNKRDEGLSDTEIIAVLKKEVKSRRDSIEIYKKAGEQERLEAEEFQVSVISSYIPESPSDDIILKHAQDALKTLNIEQPQKSDTGRIISAVKASEPLADGADIARIVNKIITGE